MNKRLFLHIINGGVEVDVVELLTYTYNAKRMGGAPTLSSTFRSFKVIDINNKCWAKFADANGIEPVDGEVFYVKQVPSTTKDNTDARYKYDIEFITERFVLDNIYVYDADVSLGEGLEESKATNKTDFIWTGNLYSYLKKLDAALAYSFRNSPLDYVRYRVSTDGVDQNDTNEQVITIKDMTFTAALQEVFNTFKTPYFFEGKVIYVGDSFSSIVDKTLKYGADSALLSVGKTNANYKTVNRVTAIGSTDNLPYFYPNDSAAGEHIIETTEGISVESLNYNILGLYADLAKDTHIRVRYNTNANYSTSTYYSVVRKSGSIGDFTLTTPQGGLIPFPPLQSKARKIENPSIITSPSRGEENLVDGFIINNNTIPSNPPTAITNTVALVSSRISVAADALSSNQIKIYPIKTSLHGYKGEAVEISYEYELEGYNLDAIGTSFYISNVDSYIANVKDNAGNIVAHRLKDEKKEGNKGSFTVSFTPRSDGLYTIELNFTCDIVGATLNSIVYPIASEFSVKRKIPSGSKEWYLQLGQKNEYDEIVYNSKDYGLSELGISLSKIDSEGDIIVKAGINRMPPQKNLVPSIYRKTYGTERFYEAVNGEYKVLYNDEKLEINPQEYVYDFGDNAFDNPFGGEVYLRREHIFTVDDIKPTIKGALYNGVPIDSFVDVAFDNDDSNEFGENEELKHGYFFAKLPPMGFNLFAMASEQGEMTISMTSGDCNSCNFVIGVGENTKRNIVEVDANGDLVRDEKGNVKIGEDLSVQNDTTDNSVWVALKKEKDTFGEWMPDTRRLIKPKAGDTYVITNIALPKIYIEEAERRLEEEIVKFLKEHNKEKFNFSVKLSRIFFAENEDVLNQLNENSIVSIEYLGNTYSGLYVSSFQVRFNENDVLPEISISLTDTLAPNAAPLQNVVNQVKAEVMASVSSGPFMAQATRTFIRKDQNDSTVHRLSANEIEVSNTLKASGNITTNSNVEAEGYATFSKGVRTDGDITIGNYREVLGSISGAKISKDGNASFNSVKANIMEISSLAYNQVRATAAYTMFDDTATIIEIEKDGNDYILTLEGDTKTDDGVYAQPFVEYDIVYGIVNKINNIESGYAAKHGECWMYITRILGDNQVKAVLYADEDTTSGINLEPTIDMLIAHRGNCGLGEFERLDRQQTFYISSKDGNFVQLLGVTRPKLYDIQNEGYSNYGAIIGKLPNDLLERVRDAFPSVKGYDPIVYAKYGVFENFLQLDYLGQPIRRSNHVGDWVQPIEEEGVLIPSYRSEVEYYDTVSHNGSLWACMKSDTTEEPSKGSDWLLLVASGKDGQGINANLLRNSNFDVYDSRGELLNVSPAYGNSKLLGSVIKGGYDGSYNSYRYGTTGNRIIRIDFGFNIKKGVTYTISFQSKWVDGDYDDIGFLLYVPTNVVSLSNINGVLYSDNTNRYTLWTVNTKEWNGYSFSFKYTPKEGGDDELSDVYIELYRWDTADGEIAQIKVEEGGIATPYLKHQDDLKGKDGVVANENLLPDTEWKYSGTTDYYAVKGWTANTSGTATLSYLVVNEKAYDIHSTLQIKSSTKVYIDLQKSDIPLSDNTVYTLSMMVKQETPLFVEFQTATSAKLDQITLSCEYSNTIGLGVGKGSSGWKGVLLDNLPASSDFQQVIIRIQTGSLGGSVKMSLGVKKGGLTATLCLLKLERGTIATPYQKAYADYATVAGPAGKPGPMIYPMGEWDKTLTYKKTDDTAPYVYYDNNSLDDTEGKYYVLNVVESTGVSPADSSEHWRQMTQFEAIYTKFLMANFAQFGSDKGAVFYDRYLISQRGTKTSSDGYYSPNSVGKTNYGEVKNEIFYNPETYVDDDLFTGKFTPNLSINFLSGEIAANNLIDRFFIYDGGTIEMGDHFNIIVEPKANVWGSKDGAYGGRFGYSGPYVVLPQDVSHMKNGARVTIIAKYSKDNLTALSDMGNEDDNSLKGYDYEYSAFALISTVRPAGVTNSKGSPSGIGKDWIICQGYRSQFMMLPAGHSVSLRLSIVGDVRYWYVEDANSWATIHPIEFFVTDAAQSSYGALDMKNFWRVEYMCYDRAYNWSDLTWTQEVENQGYKYYKPVVLTYGPIYSEYGNYLGQERPRIVFSRNSDGFKDGFRYRLLDTRGANGDIFNE